MTRIVDEERVLGGHRGRAYSLVDSTGRRRLRQYVDPGGRQAKNVLGKQKASQSGKAGSDRRKIG